MAASGEMEDLMGDMNGGYNDEFLKLLSDVNNEDERPDIADCLPGLGQDVFDGFDFNAPDMETPDMETPSMENVTSLEGSSAQPEKDGVSKLNTHGGARGTKTRGVVVKREPVNTTSAAPSVENVTSPEHSMHLERNNSVDEGQLALQKALDNARYFATDSFEKRRKKLKRGHDEDDDTNKRQKVLEDTSDDNKPRSGLNEEQDRNEKRMQKNRDTAYISRMRRRAYTKELEKAVIETAKEKTAVEREAEDLRKENELLRQRLAQMQHDMSDGSRSGASSLPSDSEREEAERHSDAGSSGNVVEFLQDILTPISPRSDSNRLNVRTTMIMFVLLFGLCLPGSRMAMPIGVRNLLRSNAIPEFGAGKMHTGEVWDPTSVLTIDDNRPFTSANSKLDVRRPDENGIDPGPAREAYRDPQLTTASCPGQPADSIHNNGANRASDSQDHSVRDSRQETLREVKNVPHIPRKHVAKPPVVSAV